MNFTKLLTLLKSRRLQVDIIVIFVVLFLAACITIIFYTYTQQSGAILKFSKQLMQQAEKDVIDEINDYLKPAAITSLTSHLLRSGALSLSRQDRITAYLEDILQAYPHMTSVYIADTKGNYIEESRTIRARLCPDKKPCVIPSGATAITRIVHHSRGAPKEIWAYKDHNNDVLKAYTFTKDLFAPRSRPWYQGALRAGEQYWLGVYPFFYSNEPGVTISFSIHNKNNKIIGVVAVDFLLDNINQFLKNQKVGKNGLLIITDDQGNIISFPHFKHKLNNLISGKVQLLNIAELGSRRLIRAFKHYEQLQSNYFVIEIDGRKYVAAFSPISTGFDRTWILGLVTPISDFVQPLIKSNEIVLVISLAIMLLGIALIVLVSGQVSKDIVRLSHEADDIREFNLEHPIVLNTHIKEVQILLTALRALKSTIASFGKYVPTDLVKKLFASGEIAELSGTKKTLTVMFSDIVSFTRIAEEVPEEQLVQMLSEYLSIFSEVISEYQGTLDKYIGDAVMAFWGAPIDDSDHVMHTCVATLECYHRINELNAKWRSAGVPEFQTRFGINSGPMVVGNMGSNNRLNYTVVGDNVNLAARLQSINKVYGTNIVVSEIVFDVIAERMLCRPLDYVRVKGKTHEVMLYELIADRQGTHQPTAEQIRLCELTSRAYYAYIKENYSSALSLYRQIAKDFPADEVSRLYTKRCETLLSE